jgi:uncharacterized protein (UPF0335 family)
MTLTNQAQGALRQYVERIERLTAEKKELADDIKEVFSEARGCGFDVKVMRKVLKLRTQSADDRSEAEAILHTYLVALGMVEQFEMFEPMLEAAE